MITLRNISKSYGAQTLFEDVSLQINENDRFALVGPNGAGKSTLFRMIMGQEQVDKGDVALRSGVRFGYLPQETPHLSGRPVLEETLEGDFSDNRKEAQAKKILMGLGFKITDFPRPVSELSGGWQMRVMIAKLLVEEPDLLMLDEPVAGMSLPERELTAALIRRIGRTRAIIVIEHDMEFVSRIADKVTVLHLGKILAEGSMSEIQQNPKVIDVYLGH